MESYFEEYHRLHMYLSVTKIIDETYRKSLNELIEIIPKIEEKNVWFGLCQIDI